MKPASRLPVAIFAALATIGLVALNCALAAPTPDESANDNRPEQEAPVDEAAGLQPAQIEKWRPKIKRLCSNKKVTISSVDDMLQLITVMSHLGVQCPRRYLAAIYELTPILMRKKERLCNDYSFAMIKHYHFRFIQPNKRNARGPHQVVKGQLHPEPRKFWLEYDQYDQIIMAPISVRHFFLKFALQVSYQCKMDLIRNLAKDQAKVLEPGDLELMAPFSDALLGGPDREPLSPSGIDFDNVLYMPELDGIVLKAHDHLDDNQDGPHKALRTTADESSTLFRMIIACKSRFKPMYDRLITPIVRLSKLGYDYQGPKGWSGDERRFLDGDLLRDWLVIVHVCEMFKDTHLVRIKPKPLTLAERLERDNKNHEDDEDESKPFALTNGVDDENEEELNDEAEPVDYEPSERFLMSDRLLVRGERELDLELARKFGRYKEGWVEGFLRRLSTYPRRALSVIDPMQFAHYRRNLGWYTGIIKMFSATVGIISLSFTIHGLIGG